MGKLVCIIVLILILTACTEQSLVTESSANIQIAYLPITHSAALMMMNTNLDPNAPYKIDLIPFTTWPDVVDALRTGRVDGANILFEVALQAKNEDDSLVLLSLSHRDGNVIVVNNDISNYQDLIGRIVAIPHRLSPQNTLLQMVLTREGIDPLDIQIVELSPAEMPFSMASGAISAYIVAEPFGAVAESAGVGRILETSDQIFPHSICCVLVFRDGSLNEDSIEWLTAEFNQAAAMTHRRDDTVSRVFMDHSRLNVDVVERALRNTSFENLQLTEEEYQTITEIILRYEVLERVPDFADFAINITRGY